MWSLWVSGVTLPAAPSCLILIFSIQTFISTHLLKSYALHNINYDDHKYPKEIHKGLKHLLKECKQHIGYGDAVNCFTQLLKPSYYITLWMFGEAAGGVVGDLNILLYRYT